MEHIGVDVHKMQSQICILGDEGEVIEQRIRTDRRRFAAVLGSRSRARVLLEASTESEWVAQSIERLGHEVIVADPNYALMYATRNRRVKTDRRDARVLAEACRLGAYRRAHRRSATRRQVQAALIVREALVRSRSRYISVVRTLVRREGLRVGTGSTAKFLDRLDRVVLPPALAAELAPVRAVLGPLTAEIHTADQRLERLVHADAVMRRLRTVPGVGPITAASFTVVVDDVARFHDAHRVAAYLGLVPSEHSSGERRQRGAITKMGNRRVRWILVQAAWALWRDRTERTAVLRRWAERIAERRGRPVAVVALARRLAGILYAMWRDGTDYEPARVGPHTVTTRAA